MNSADLGTPINKDLLKEYYSTGMSMMDISKKLNCSAHKVGYWMDKHGIKRRNLSDATYVKRNPNGNPFKIKDKLSPSEIQLYGLGIGIYWGEGSKVSKHAVSIANTDPKMILTFRKFLRTICQANEEKIRYSIITFNNANPEDAKMYWSKQLQISPSKFGKIVQIPPQGRGTYRKKSQFGVCTLNFSNVKLKTWIMEQISKFE